MGSNPGTVYWMDDKSIQWGVPNKYQNANNSQIIFADSGSGSSSNPTWKSKQIFIVDCGTIQSKSIQRKKV
jgi:hypothetical protein